VGHVVDQ